MILIENVLGNIKKDPVWQAKLKDSTIDLLVLDQREAQKSRCRKFSSQGADLGISLERNVVLTDGDVLFWNDTLNTAIVVQIQLRDVMVISLNELKKRSFDELVKTCFELGHALGNQHWKAVTKNNEVYVPLTVATTMMDSVMKTHGFQHLPYHLLRVQKFCHCSLIRKLACYLVVLRIRILMFMSAGGKLHRQFLVYILKVFTRTIMNIVMAIIYTNIKVNLHWRQFS